MDMFLPFWLDSAEIARLEEDICAQLRRFIKFGAHALYFSQSGLPELISEECRLLLPIQISGKPVATLRLDDVEPCEIAPVLPLLPELAGLCLETIVAGLKRDAQTGLPDEEKFICEFERRIYGARNGTGVPNCLGLLVIDLTELAAGANAAARGLPQEALPRIACVIQKNMPECALAARVDKLSGKIAFAILFPASSRVFCQKIARNVVLALEDIAIVDPLSGRESPIHASAGHSLYPHDLSGRELKLVPYEQALLIRDRARLAAKAAWNADNLTLPVTAWGWIPMLCCAVMERVGHRFVRLNHGSSAGIRENQRYFVIPRNEAWEASRAKAQIAIRKAREDEALAEIVYATAGGQVDPGDGVILIRETQESNASDGLESQSKFLERLKSRADSRFALVVSRIIGSGLHGRPGALSEIYSRHMPEGAFSGQYGSDGIILYLPGEGADAARGLLGALHGEAKSLGLELASGIFAYPCLNFGRDESECCVLKALAYAELLPAPHIGCLDAYALAISADKRFSKGDETGALEEYRQALLLNPADSMLLNSLGVCFAALNRHGEAKRCFEQALHICEERGLQARINYNLGNLHLKNNEASVAIGYFRLAVKADPGHFYAWTRLAGTHERVGQPNLARALYRHAARLAGGDTASLNMIHRQLARLEKESDSAEKAREILHDALVRDPADSASLLLLAQTYIRDDPAMAEGLARRCIAQGHEARDVLLQALTALGRADEAF